MSQGHYTCYCRDPRSYAAAAAAGGGTPAAAPAASPAEPAADDAAPLQKRRRAAAVAAAAAIGAGSPVGAERQWLHFNDNQVREAARVPAVPPGAL